MSAAWLSHAKEIALCTLVNGALLVYPLAIGDWTAVFLRLLASVCLVYYATYCIVGPLDEWRDNCTSNCMVSIAVLLFMNVAFHLAVVLDATPIVPWMQFLLLEFMAVSMAVTGYLVRQHVLPAAAHIKAVASRVPGF